MEQLWRAVGWRRLLVTAFCLAAWRALEQVTVPGLQPTFISDRLQLVDTSSLIHAIGSGLPLISYSIVTLGLQPYINALIVMSLLLVISRRIRTSVSGARGEQQLLSWTRALAALFALGQAYSFVAFWQSSGAFPPQIDWFPRLLIALELTGGTMILVLLADVLDEYGLGFGNGAVFMYALTSLFTEVHSLAELLASAPSIEALYLPFGIWLAFSIAIAAATVAVLLAVRRLPASARKDKKPSKPTELRILMSGVLRPPLFTGAVLFVPLIIANYYAQRNPGLARWLIDYATAYGPNPWADAAYVAIEMCLVIGFTYFIVTIDWQSAMKRELLGHVRRLAVIGGGFLAVTVYVMPVLEWEATSYAGHGIPVSGFDVVLLVTMVLAIFVSIERFGRDSAETPILMSRVP